MEEENMKFVIKFSDTDISKIDFFMAMLKEYLTNLVDVIDDYPELAKSSIKNVIQDLDEFLNEEASK